MNTVQVDRCQLISYIFYDISQIRKKEVQYSREYNGGRAARMPARRGGWPRLVDLKNGRPRRVAAAARTCSQAPASPRPVRVGHRCAEAPARELVRRHASAPEAQQQTLGAPSNSSRRVEKREARAELHSDRRSFRSAATHLYVDVIIQLT